MARDVLGRIRKHTLSISFGLSITFLLFGIVLTGRALCTSMGVPLTEDTEFPCTVLVLPDLVVVLSATVLGALIAVQAHRDWLSQKHGEHDGQPGSLKMSGHGWRLEVSDSGWKFEASGPGVKCRDGASPEPEQRTKDDEDEAPPTGKQCRGTQ